MVSASSVKGIANVSEIAENACGDKIDVVVVVSVIGIMLSA